MSFDFFLGNDVHVWRCDLRSIISPRIESALSDDELARANAFVFERDRVRYRAGRWLLRALLARYLDVPMRSVPLVSPEHEKPRLAVSNLRFNVSHCGDSYALVVCDGTEVGVDLELPREVPDANEMARMVFSAEEVDALERLPGEQVGPAFLRGWTRKEAYIKALGIGLGGADLKAITVGLEAELRIVPPIQGISSQQIAVRSLLSSDGYLAIAAHPDVTQFQVRNLDASTLGFLAGRT